MVEQSAVLVCSMSSTELAVVVLLLLMMVRLRMSMIMMMSKRKLAKEISMLILASMVRTSLSCC